MPKSTLIKKNIYIYITVLVIIRRNIDINLISHFHRWKSKIIPLFHPLLPSLCSRLCLRDAHTSQDVPRAEEGGCGREDERSGEKKWATTRARTRDGCSHATARVTCVNIPFPAFFPVTPCSLPSLPVSPFIRALCGILFAFVLAIFLAYDRRVFSHVTQLFGSFFLITCSLKSTLIANDSSPGTFLNSPSINSVRTGIFLCLEMSIVIYLNANLVVFDIIYYH